MTTSDPAPEAPIVPPPPGVGAARRGVEQEEPARGDARLWVGLGLVALVGLALRAVHMSIPMRYDEAHTFLVYAAEGWAQASTAYDTPNNHILNSLLVSSLTGLLGNHPVVIRLPAYLAGSLLPLAVGWMAVRLYGRGVAVLSAAFVATSPVLIEYSTNARGYALVTLLGVLAFGVADDLLRQQTIRGWATLAILGVLGFYTVPVMLLPWCALSIWIAVNLYRRGDGVLAWIRRLGPLAATQLIVALVVAALYAPVAGASGVAALVDNRFVVRLPWSEFFASALPSFNAVARHWAKGIPAPAVLILASGVAAALALSAYRRRFPLLWSILFGSVMVLAVQRNFGPERVWLWALPLVLTVSAAGIVALLVQFAQPRTVARLTTAGTALWTLGASLVILLARPVWSSLETGAFHEGVDVSSFIVGRLQPGDRVVTDWRTREPLAYYLQRIGAPASTLAAPISEAERVWVVLNLNEANREREVRRRAEVEGFPIASATSVLESGAVRVHLFGAAPGI